MMSSAPGLIERAFQLTECSSNVEQIRVKLRQEGYANVDAHLSGSKIRADLIKIIRRPSGSSK